MDRLFSDLESEPTLQLGEIGLDRRFENTLPMERQIGILRQELEFGIARNKSISLHCVRATEPMLKLLSDLRFREFSILWHGFTGSKETARQLCRLGVLISIGPRFKGSISELFRGNPHLVPETDYVGSDMKEHDILLENQYQRFSKESGMAMINLETHCRTQFNLFCGNTSVRDIKNN